METRQIVRVVLASPSDVQDERNIVADVVSEVNKLAAHRDGLQLELKRWETDVHSGFHVDGPQGLIDDVLQIEDSAILIGIFWKKFGTPVSDAGSGTEHEFLRAYKSWKSTRRPEIMLYFKEADFFPRTPEELEQVGAVMAFKKRIEKEGVYTTFVTPSDFEKTLRHQLTEVVRKLATPNMNPAVVDQVESVLATVQSVVPPRKPRRFPRYLPHDNVLWEDEGKNDFLGGLMVEGPLCPEDRATLRIRGGRSKETASVDISDGYLEIGQYRSLTCPECLADYQLTPDGSDKKLHVSMDEVRARFEGLRRQT